MQTSFSVATDLPHLWDVLSLIEEICLRSLHADNPERNVPRRRSFLSEDEYPDARRTAQLVVLAASEIKIVIGSLATETADSEEREQSVLPASDDAGNTSNAPGSYVRVITGFVTGLLSLSDDRHSLDLDWLIRGLKSADATTYRYLAAAADLVLSASVIAQMELGHDRERETRTTTPT